MKKVILLAIIFGLTTPFILSQPKGADIYGTAVLPDGSSIPGVLVTITGNRIGTKTTVTNDKGKFRFFNLPPGIYEVKLELEGFQTTTKKTKYLRYGGIENLEIEMETDTIREEVIVTGKSPVLSHRKTTNPTHSSGTFAGERNVSKDFLESIPTARNPWTILGALPGLMVDRVDVGGAESGQQSAFFAYGSDADDSVWNVDGAQITDPSAIGAAPAYLNTNSYEEMQVTMGANDITNTTGGVEINFVTKRGGNYFNGDLHLYADGFGMGGKPTDYMEQNDLVVPGIQRLYQYGVNVGGPVVKDKLWWFGSWAIQDIHKRNEAELEDATWLVSGYGKLNFQLGNTSGDFHISYDAKTKWGRTALSPSQQDEGSLWDQKGPGSLYYGGLSHVFGELMLNVKAVYTDGGFTLDPRGADIDPATGHLEGTDSRVYGGGDMVEGSNYYYKTNRNSVNLALDGNYFLEGALGGDHEIRFGVDYYTADTTSQTLFPNQRMLYVYPDNPQMNYITFTPDHYQDSFFKRTSFYIQDIVTWGKLTASFGLRYDKETGGVNPFTLPTFTWYEPGSPHHGEILFPCFSEPVEQPEKFQPDTAWSLISPRMSFTYDINGDGKNVVKLSAARYGSQSGNTLGMAYTPYRRVVTGWHDFNGDLDLQWGEWGDIYSFEPWQWWWDICPEEGTPSVQWDPDYNTPYLDELTLAFEKALADDLAVELTAFFKKSHNLSQDIASDGTYQSVSRGIMPDGTLETKDNWMYTGTTRVGGTDVPVYQQIERPVGRYYYNLDKAYNSYTGLQFLLTKKLSNKWMANLSFTWQNWKRHRFEEETLDMNNFDFFNSGGYIAPVSNGSGLRDIWVNSRWMVKLTGMYQLPYGINLTGFFQAREGYPQPLRRLVVLSQGPTYLYRTGYKVGDERLPTFWMLNLGLEKTLKITDTVTATLVIDWYNATNNQIELKHNLNIGAEDPGEPQPVMWTNAGLFQFGVRVDF